MSEEECIYYAIADDKRRHLQRDMQTDQIEIYETLEAAQREFQKMRLSKKHFAIVLVVCQLKI